VDDGWFVDDLRVTETLGATSPTALLDSADRSSLPPCEGVCSATVSIEATPNPVPAPGNATTVSTSPGQLDGCPGGDALYSIWRDGDGDGAIGGQLDWRGAEDTSPPSFEGVPEATTRYFVRARCSTRPACFGEDSVLVELGCPAPLTYSPHAWWAKLTAEVVPYHGFIASVPDAGQWARLARGLLSGLRSDGTFGGESLMCPTWPPSSLRSYFPCDDPEIPPRDDGFYYLRRPGARTIRPRTRETPASATGRSRCRLDVPICPAQASLRDSVAGS
jgi:hypothetical protein